VKPQQTGEAPAAGQAMKLPEPAVPKQPASPPPKN